MVCKPCPATVAARAAVDAAAADAAWSWCAGKGPGALCVPMTVFPEKALADEWFAGQGRPERVRLVVVTDRESVTWGDPSTGG